MTPGLTVSFWLKITSSDLAVPLNDQQQQHQYIISSGGQVSNSRGFSFLYAAEEQKFKLQLQTRYYVYMIEFSNLQETWCHIAFTWKKEGSFNRELLQLSPNLLNLFRRKKNCIISNL